LDFGIVVTDMTRPRKHALRCVGRAALVPAAFALSAGLLSPAWADDTPRDPYPWCAVYSGNKGGGTNCGFSTLDQCRATVSGIGGFCEPNLFYTGPDRPVRHPRKRHRD